MPDVEFKRREANGLFAVFANVAIGGNPSGSASAEYRYDAWSFAPSTVPPEGQPVGWVRRNDGPESDVDVASLPTTFTANGAQWSLASDLATAEGNVTSRPAICVAQDGCSALTNDALPVTWTGGGVTHIAANDLATAESERGSARPAVLFGDDGAEAVV